MPLTLTDFTPSNTRQLFYLSMRNPLGVKGLKILRMGTRLTNITSMNFLEILKITKILGIPWFASSWLWAYSVNPPSQVLCGTIEWLSVITIIFEKLLNFQALKRYLGLFPPFSFLFPFCCNFAFTAACVLFSRNIWQLRKLWRVKQRRHLTIIKLIFLGII